MTPIRAGAVTLAILAAAACASSGQHPGTSGGDPNVISAEELREATVTDLLSLIQLRRPQWLNRNRSLSFNDPGSFALVVYMDNAPYGTSDVLRTVLVRSLLEVRYFSPSEAESRFGVGNSNGVIQLITRSH